MFLIRCSQASLALEFPGVHPPETCHGAARVGGHGPYHPIGQRMEEVEAVERNQMPIKHSTVFSLKRFAAYGTFVFGLL